MEQRIQTHPILTPEERNRVRLAWEGSDCFAYEGETISAALFANGVRVFGHHIKDQSPQGIYCANGQCAQCTVLADGLPVKACMTLVKEGMVIEPANALPELPETSASSFTAVETIEVECLVIGGGPAGLSAVDELGKLGVSVLLVDDKHRLGGKLVLQTHRFFGSINACYAGTRGIDIATKLEGLVRDHPSVEIWLDSTALAVFSDGLVGILKQGNEYALVRPKTLLVAAGAREKSLIFQGNTLPGVYGAGAFQTLVNRDMVKASNRLFVVGGGNVGLIAAYHALQAGIEVAGLVEAMPKCGGYKVHRDKLARFGVPIMTSHTVLSANGDGQVESVTVAAIDENWNPIPGTEKQFACDTVLVAVGLDPVDEFYHKAAEYGMQVFAAGDAEEIAEASAAIYSGKIKGHDIAAELGYLEATSTEEWAEIAEVLKSKPGAVILEDTHPIEPGVVKPIFHCNEEIPCNPCTSVCPQGLIFIEPEDIRLVPKYIADEIGKECIACNKCITICPGLAITLVDARKEGDPLVTIPYEFGPGAIEKGDMVTVVDIEGKALGQVQVERVRLTRASDRTALVQVHASDSMAPRIAGIMVQDLEPESKIQLTERITDETIVCRCERVTLQEIKDLIAAGSRDINEIKGLTRAGMGACGGKTCQPLIQRAFRELGISPDEVTLNVPRPLFVEVEMGVFAGAGDE
ncbi:MAG: FAD-dependent oxidoreductase [Chloroflexota bacterium]